MKHPQRLLRLLAWSCLCWCASSVRADDGLADATLSRLKAATVFVKVAAPRFRGSGSGFLFRVQGDLGHVATNHHVVSGFLRSGGLCEVVFLSGAGGDEEFTLPARVVAADEDRDLAVLEVTRQDLPQPLSLEPPESLRETAGVYILGFPFGEALAQCEGNPAVTVGRGSISSLRRDARGDLNIIQVDGDLNPGNSGGPVVDTQGRLVGVACAVVPGSQIAMAIPATSLHAMLQGRIESASYSEQVGKRGAVDIAITIELIDPLRAIRGVTVFYIEKNAVKEPAGPGADRLWPQWSPRMRKVELALAGRQATGKVALKGEREDLVYMFQPSYVRGDGRTRYAEPGEVVAHFSRAGDDDGDNPKRGDGSAGGGTDQDDDWLGSEKQRAQEKKLGQGKPALTGTDLASEVRTVVDAKVMALKLEAESLLDQMAWSPDAKFVYAAHVNGMVRKIAVPSFKEERVFDVKRNCSWLALSAVGLLVVCQDLQEIWILDPGTLEFKGRISVPSVRHLTTGPKLKQAYTTLDGDTMVIIDLEQREVVKRYTTHQLLAKYGKNIRSHPEGVTLSEFGLLRVAPDGKNLFCVGFECLHRFEVQGTELEYVEMGARIASNGQQIVVSDDSKYVCIPSGGGNRANVGHPNVGYGTYIYKVSDLQRPIMAIASGAYPRAIGFDRAAGLIYGQNFEKQLITFTPTGQSLKEYVFTDRGDDTRQFLVHPEGKKMLLRSARALLWVELP